MPLLPMAELDELVASPWCDTPRDKIPEDWRERDPGPVSRKSHYVGASERRERYARLICARGAGSTAGGR